MNGAPTSTFATQYLGTPLGRIFAFETEHKFTGTGVTIGGTAEAALQNNDPEDAGNQAIDGYKAFNLYTEYRPRGAEFLTVRFEANNIFDEAYADRATYGQDFPTVLPLLEPGRSFLLMVRAEF